MSKRTQVGDFLVNIDYSEIESPVSTVWTQYIDIIIKYQIKTFSLGREEISRRLLIVETIILRAHNSHLHSVRQTYFLG